jgi:hypothetical protein
MFCESLSKDIGFRRQLWPTLVVLFTIWVLLPKCREGKDRSSNQQRRDSAQGRVIWVLPEEAANLTPASNTQVECSCIPGTLSTCRQPHCIWEQSMAVDAPTAVVTTASTTPLDARTLATNDKPPTRDDGLASKGNVVSWSVDASPNAP